MFAGFPDLVNNISNNHISEMIAYDKNGLKIIFSLKPFPGAPNTTSINIEAKNNTHLPMSEFLFQVAVPKVCILDSANTIIVFKLFIVLKILFLIYNLNINKKEIA